jgi:hypothetical protein
MDMANKQPTEIWEDDPRCLKPAIYDSMAAALALQEIRIDLSKKRAGEAMESISKRPKLSGETGSSAARSRDTAASETKNSEKSSTGGRGRPEDIMEDEAREEAGWGEEGAITATGAAAAVAAAAATGKEVEVDTGCGIRWRTGRTDMAGMEDVKDEEEEATAAMVAMDAASTGPEAGTRAGSSAVAAEAADGADCCREQLERPLSFYFFS